MQRYTGVRVLGLPPSQRRLYWAIFSDGIDRNHRTVASYP